MNIFLRIGQLIENRREYVKVTNALNDALDTLRCNCGFEEADLFAKVVLDKYKDPFGIAPSGWWVRQTSRIPARLRFNVDHRRFEIIIGNPVTQCDMREGKYTHYNAVNSVCNPKDTYNWKRAAIVALENFVDQHHLGHDLSKLCFESMFKKYPELKSKP